MLATVLVVLAVLGGTAVRGATVGLNFHSSEGIRSHLEVGSESVFHADGSQDDLSGLFHSRKILVSSLGKWFRSRYTPPPAEAPAEVAVVQAEEETEDLNSATKPDESTIDTATDTDAATPSEDVQCGEILFNVDFSGEDITSRTVQSDHACLLLCTSTVNCKAYSRFHDNGRCFIKNIPEGHPTTTNARMNSYLLCPDEIEADVAQEPDGEAPDSASAPFVPDSRSNPHPDSTPHPEELHVIDDSGATRTEVHVRALEQGAHAWFDYQINGAYNPSLGTLVVSRDWFYGQVMFAERSYSICYVNAFQTQADCPDCAHSRPDFTSAWPADLMMADFEDPIWPGEYIIDISTPEKRTAAAAHVHEMTKVCEDKLFDAIEFGNLDSFLRFPNLPFTLEDTVEYAKLLVADAHGLGLAVAQKNTIELIDTGDYKTIGFDFALTESCGQNGECAQFSDAYAGKMLAVEYTDDGFANACKSIGDVSAVVQRDKGLSEPESSSFVMKQCGP